jgi:ATP-dependent DNA ligase
MLHLEGVVAKKADEPYRHGTRAWVKVKHYDTADLVIGGVRGSPERVSHFLRFYDEDGSLTYVGQTVAIPARAAAELGAWQTAPSWT